MSRLEEFIEAAKRVVEPGATPGTQAEARPGLNRFLIIAAFDFGQITRSSPSYKAYVRAMDHSRHRSEPLMLPPDDRLEVADFHLSLMDIVGIDSSDGWLNAYRRQAAAHNATKRII